MKIWRRYSHGNLIAGSEYGQPRRNPSRRGCLDSARGLVSRILFVAVIPLGAASPRTLISDLPGGSGACSSRLDAPGRHAAQARLSGPRIPPYLVLLRVGFTLPPSLLPERCALTAPFHPYQDWPSRRMPFRPVPWARQKTRPGWRYVFCGTGRLCVLKRTSRTLSGTLPCGVRTFLPRQTRLHAHAGSDRPVLLPAFIVA
jgi:hypothetical protein